jgi:hypothetical protein
VVGLAFAAAILVGANALAMSRRHGVLGILFSLFVVGLLLLAWRRFLRSVTYEPDSAVLVAKGVLPFVRFRIPLASLESVHATRVVGIDGRGRYNLVLRRKGSIQPLILEVRTDREDDMAKAFLEQFRS